MARRFEGVEDNAEHALISVERSVVLLCSYHTFSMAFLAKLFEDMMSWIRNLFWKQEMELTMVGLQNAGKSTLVSVFATGAFTEDMIPTVGFNMRKVTKGNVSIKLWDLGGQPRFRSMWER